MAKASVRTDIVPEQNDVRPSTAKELNISRKETYEARRVRDAEDLEPGLVGKTIDALIKSGHEPTKTKIRNAILDAINRPKKARPRPEKESSWEREKRTDPCYFAMMETVSSPQHLQGRDEILPLETLASRDCDPVAWVAIEALPEYYPKLAAQRMENA